MQQEILKVKDVAELLQLSPRQVMNLCKTDSPNPLPHIQINGRALRFRKSDVDLWFSKNLVSAI